MNYFLVAIAVTSFPIYGYAIQGTFSRSYGVSIRMRLIQVGGMIFALIHVWALSNTASRLSIAALVAVAFYLGGIGAFFAAKRALQGFRLTLAFSPDLPEHLIQAGIYSRVRHPFYMAYSLTWIGGVVAARSILTASTACLMIASYLWAARHEERKFSLSALGPAYDAYRSRAGMIWPKRVAR
jgi:protein-S-isoprenylcysteine O-methyltransferase Ste14